MSSISSLCGSAVLTAFVFSAPPLALALVPGEGAAMLVFAPHVEGGALRVMAQADARLVRASGRSSIAVVSSPEPGLAARLYRAGATLVLDGRLIPGCTSRTGPLS